MMDDPNLASIAASYAIAAAVVAWMAVRIAADHAGLTRALARIDRRKRADRT